MRNTLAFSLLLFLQLATLLPAEGKGQFQTYNNDERQKFLNTFRQKYNEVNAQEFYEEKYNAKSNGADAKSVTDSKYDPTWDSLDARPLPAWYDQSKIGIFIHWGVYSVPGIASEWFWKQWTEGNKECNAFMDSQFKPNFTYQEFGPQFTGEFYDPYAWAELFAKSGAKYIVLTSKHHEGYTLWPSKYSFSWNAKDVGPHRDLVGDLATAIRTNTSLKFGLYHSLYEWYNPLWIQDRDNNHTTSDFVQFKILPEMHEIVNTYKPEIFWSDGEWEAPDTYWNSKEFIAWLYNESPVKDSVVTNDRWGHETLCTHGGYYTCADRYNPGTLQPHKWENCMTLDKESWGFRRNAKIEEYLTPEELISTIASSVACGGNVLVNVGPTREGMIVPIQQERLLQMGEWLEINGDAIYNSVPWKFQNDTLTPDVWYTASASGSTVYAMITSWPGSSIRLGAVNGTTGLSVSMLGYTGTLQWTGTSEGVTILLPRPDDILSKWVWTLSINIP